MTRLIGFELLKTYGKKSFILFLLALLACNVFFLNFLNPPEEEEYYKEYSYQDEKKNVEGYEEYLEGIAKSKDRTQAISIFTKEKEDYVSRNITKSAFDHKDLSGKNVRFIPSYKVSLPMEAPITDILIILSVMLIACASISEEKNKTLFSITRATKRGFTHNILAKLGALFIHSLAFTGLLYGSNLIYSYVKIGGFDPSAQIQSVSSYMESDLAISLGEYIALSVVTKAILIFAFGAFLTALAIVGRGGTFAPIIGMAYLGINYLLYALIPAISPVSVLKHLSFFSIIKTEKLYGGYLNLNIFEYAVSWRITALIGVGILTSLTVAAATILFCKSNSGAGKGKRLPGLPWFKPHGNLMVHEAYKIFIMSKALPILLVFVVLIGYGYLSKTYYPSSGEEYYQEIMLQLEGELTNKKAEMYRGEKERFEEANEQIKKIDELVSTGKISRISGDDLKMKWEQTLQFEPYFKRVASQYERIKEKGGVFIYDTGYRYVFGQIDGTYLTDFALLSLALVLAFGNAFTMEEAKGSWTLLGATRRGKKDIIKGKIVVCGIGALVLSVVPWLFRFMAIQGAYPMNLLAASLDNLPGFFESGVTMPIWCFILFKALAQAITMIMVLAGVLFISSKQKAQLTSLCISLLVFALPAILAMMGIGILKYFSIFSIYCLP